MCVVIVVVVVIDDKRRSILIVGRCCRRVYFAIGLFEETSRRCYRRSLLRFFTFEFSIFSGSSSEKRKKFVEIANFFEFEITIRVEVRWWCFPLVELPCLFRLLMLRVVFWFVVILVHDVSKDLQSISTNNNNNNSQIVFFDFVLTRCSTSSLYLSNGIISLSFEWKIFNTLTDDNVTLGSLFSSSAFCSWKHFPLPNRTKSIEVFFFFFRKAYCLDLYAK